MSDYELKLAIQIHTLDVIHKHICWQKFQIKRSGIKTITNNYFVILSWTRMAIISEINALIHYVTINFDQP